LRGFEITGTGSSLFEGFEITGIGNSLGGLKLTKATDGSLWFWKIKRTGTDGYEQNQRPDQHSARNLLQELVVVIIKLTRFVQSLSAERYSPGHAGLPDVFCGTRAVERVQEVPPVWQIGSQQSTKTQNRNLQLFMLPCTVTQSLWWIIWFVACQAGNQQASHCLVDHGDERGGGGGAAGEGRRPWWIKQNQISAPIRIWKCWQYDWSYR